MWRDAEDQQSILSVKRQPEYGGGLPQDRISNGGSFRDSKFDFPGRNSARGFLDVNHLPSDPRGDVSANPFKAFSHLSSPQVRMEEIQMVHSSEMADFNCSALVLPNNTICLEHPEEMLKPWKTHPMFFEIIIVHVIIFVFGVFGNVIVIVVMAGDGKSRSATNFFLVSLALGDLLMLCVYGPLETYTHFVIKWDENGAVCKTAKFAELVSATSSVLNLLAVTIERFIVIVFPMKSQTFCTVGNMMKAVLSVWILSLILAAPVVLTTSTYKITFTNNVTSLTLNYCTRSGDSPDFVVYQFFIIFCIPSITMTVCYSFVIRELWVSTKKMNILTNGVSFRKKASKTSIAFFKRETTKGAPVYSMVDDKFQHFVPKNLDCNNRSKSSRKSFQSCQEDCGRGPARSCAFVATNKDEANNARKQVIKMLILVVVLFYLCWGPRVSMDVLQKFNLFQYNQSIYKMRIVFNVLTFFHGCINPFIYSFMSKNFRSRLLRYLEKYGCKKRSDWPRLGLNQMSMKSHPRTSSCRLDCDGRSTGAKQYPRGSFMSCETKATELESALSNIGPQSSTAGLPHPHVC